MKELPIKIDRRSFNVAVVPSTALHTIRYRRNYYKVAYRVVPAVAVLKYNIFIPKFLPGSK